MGDRGEHGQLGVGPGGLPVQRRRDLLHPHHHRLAAKTGPQVDTPAQPPRMEGQHDEHHRPAPLMGQARQVQRPDPALVGIRAELHLEDDQRRLTVIQHQIGRERRQLQGRKARLHPLHRASRGRPGRIDGREQIPGQGRALAKEVYQGFVTGRRHAPTLPRNLRPLPRYNTPVTICGAITRQTHRRRGRRGQTPPKPPRRRTARRQ